MLTIASRSSNIVMNHEFASAGGLGAVINLPEIIAGTVGKENTYGTIVGRIAPGSFTYCRVATDDLNGKITAYVGEGEFTKDTLQTFGGYGVIQVPRFQALLAYICEQGYEHHVSATRGEHARALAEALDKYLGWATYHHA